MKTGSGNCDRAESINLCVPALVWEISIQVNFIKDNRRQEEWSFRPQYRNKGSGRPCSDVQIKGNCYADYCPCILGYECKYGYCE
ncbi:hypothetical protein MTO96_041102 [Rhipicephalus appendiculatus]